MSTAKATYSINKPLSILSKICENGLKNVDIYENVLKLYQDRMNKDTNSIKNILNEVEKYLKLNLNGYIHSLNSDDEYDKLLPSKEMTRFLEFVQKEVSILNTLKESIFFVNLKQFSSQALPKGQKASETKILNKKTQRPKSVSSWTDEVPKVTERPLTINESKPIVPLIKPQPEIDIQSLTKQFSNVVASEKLGPYVIENLKKVIHQKVIYASEFNYHSAGGFDFDMKFYTNDDNLAQLKPLYENVEVTIMKREKNICISSLLRAMENFFLIFIKRRDEDGNYMFKGVINTQFTNFENYFTNKFKSLHPIETIQIKVYMIKSDLFEDYSELYDKTNLHRSDTNILLSNCENLRRIREHFSK